MQLRSGIYLDSNAGSPLKSTVQEVLLSWLREPSIIIPNSSSIHAHGRRAKKALAEARESIALSLGSTTDPEQLIFTSSGTESNQLVIQSVMQSALDQGIKPHWVTTPVEHDSNRQMIQWITQRGGSVTFLPIDDQGAPIALALRDLIRPETVLVSVLWVNNETGVISPVEKIASICRKASITLHVDAAQAWGKLPIDLERLGAHWVTFSGHKIGALAGTGLVWLARGQKVHSLILGKQEKGRRGGTENTLGIIALGAAARSIDPLVWADRVMPLRDQLQQEIYNSIPGAFVNGGLGPRVANTLNLSFEGIEGDGLVMALDLAGYSVSSGSACASGVLEPSHVLMAMGKTKLQAMSAVRVSLADELPWNDLEKFCRVLKNTVERVRSVSQ
ncbi:cysteine desulfurase [bacterium]|jgi:cysteine desulfurase|nr:cysteine desulfurase [bacterium]